MPRLNEQTRARAIGLLQADVPKWRFSRIGSHTRSILLTIILSIYRIDNIIDSEWAILKIDQYY